MEDYNDLIQQRFKKLAEISEMGIQPYAGKFETTSKALLLEETYGATTKEELETNRVTVTLAGRLVGLRSFGKAGFCHIQDGSGRIQLYVQKNTLGDDLHALFKKLDIGDFIGITGFLFRTKTNELTVDVEKFTLLAKSLRPLPEKWHGLDRCGDPLPAALCGPDRQSRCEKGLCPPDQDRPGHPPVS